MPKALPGWNPILDEPFRGFAASLGLTVEDWGDGRVALAMALGPQHMGRSGEADWWVILALANSATGLAGIAGSGRTDRRGGTVQLTVSRVAGARVGPLRARATRVAGDDLFIARADIFDGEDTLCAVAQGSFRCFTQPKT